MMVFDFVGTRNFRKCIPFGSTSFSSISFPACYYTSKACFLLIEDILEPGGPFSFLLPSLASSLTLSWTVNSGMKYPFSSLLS